MATIVETATGTVDKPDVDPVTLDLIENGLRNARYEMDEVLFRTALSPGIREQHDEFPLIGDPEREDGGRPVRPFGARFPRGLRRDDRGGRRPAHLRPLRLRRRDQPRQRLADRHADLPRGPGRGVGVDVRAHVRRRRQDPVVDADRRPHDLRGGRGHPALQAVREGRAQRGRAADRAQPGAQARLEPRRPQRARRRLPHRRAPGRRDVRAVRHRHLPRRARRPPAAQLRRDEGAAVDGVRGGPHAVASPTTSATTASATAPTSSSSRSRAPARRCTWTSPARRRRPRAR